MGSEMSFVGMGKCLTFAQEVVGKKDAMANDTEASDLTLFNGVQMPGQLRCEG